MKLGCASRFIGNPFLPRFRESYLILRTKENREEGEWVTRWCFHVTFFEIVKMVEYESRCLSTRWLSKAILVNMMEEKIYNNNVAVGYFINFWIDYNYSSFIIQLIILSIISFYEWNLIRSVHFGMEYRFSG